MTRFQWCWGIHMGTFGSKIAWAKLSRMNIPTSLKPSHSASTCLWRWNRQCSKTSAYKTQTPRNYPEESIKHSQHGESLKSRKQTFCLQLLPTLPVWQCDICALNRYIVTDTAVPVDSFCWYIFYPYSITLIMRHVFQQQDLKIKSFITPKSTRRVFRGSFITTHKNDFPQHPGYQSLPKSSTNHGLYLWQNETTKEKYVEWRHSLKHSCKVI
jgi:hypothetical protein